MFRRKTIIPAIIAGTLVGPYAAVPGAHAEAAAQAQPEASMEARESRKHHEGKAGQGALSKKQKAAEDSRGMESALDNAWLNGKLDTALLFTDELNSFAIDSDIKDGVAYLTGTVESDIQRDLAGEIALSVDGVDSVDNKLSVEAADANSAEKTADTAAAERFRNAVESAALTARIKGELLVNSNTSGLSIDIDSTSDQVTLSGSVDSDASRELAEKIAQNAAGDREIENNLRVETNS